MAADVTLQAIAEPVLAQDPAAQPLEPASAPVPEGYSKIPPPTGAFPRDPTAWPPPPIPGTQEIPGVYVETGFGFMTLRGPNVTAYFQTQLINLLRQFRD
jgi:hypothetical protein